MPPGSKPKPPGQSDQRETKFTWQLAENEGWQHGKVPPCPKGLSQHGQKAWKTWMNSWWACFYTPEDLPGLELLVLLYDKVMLEIIDGSKIMPPLVRAADRRPRRGRDPRGRGGLLGADAGEAVGGEVCDVAG